MLIDHETLRARRKQRWHYNANGQPKCSYLMPGARAAAVEMNQHDGREHPVEAYQCPLCGAWHVGRVSRSQRPDVIVYEELGKRAASNLKMENVGNKERRTQIVITRLRTAAKRRALLDSQVA